ncbi:MAG: type IV pilin-like G/H family protein [Symplocastrum torsivum CPER-KK1]|jgi:type II secretion system protein G|uniref:Type IV pilin-like G/H family protein n=1 Tax=Symplocastrum torsivum CPER-KK1 TaxID=450513 RepID=A0A951U966_9CYAN|nr:type IV pilin-like G/H family protein [Symplocastrum torsivum CPER-KK1]
MKLDLQAKFLQHLNKKKQDEGFTLIELLVVIIIIGILAAIALPSFLNQANKAKQSEAKTYVGSMNRAQQAFFLENNYMTEFDGGKGFAALGLGVATQTTNYTYNIDGGATEAPPTVTVGDPSAQVTNQAQPRAASIKAYIGGVALGEIADTSEATTLAVLCEAKIASGIQGGVDGSQPATFDAAGGPPTCPDPDYKPVGGK